MNDKERDAAIDPNDCPKLTLLNDLTNEAVYDARTDMDLRGLLEKAYDAGYDAALKDSEDRVRAAEDVIDRNLLALCIVGEALEVK